MRKLIAAAVVTASLSGCANNTPQALLDEGHAVTGSSALSAPALRDCITRNWQNVVNGALVLPDAVVPPEQIGLHLRVDGAVMAVVRISPAQNGSTYTAHWFQRMLFGKGVRAAAVKGC